MSRIRVTQIKSAIGRPRPHRLTLHALGLRKIRQSVEHDNTPSIRGMLFEVRHLVQVEDLDEKARP